MIETQQPRCSHCGDVAEVTVIEDGQEKALCLSDTGCATDPAWASLPQRPIR